jgi:hypothetical protein
MKNKFHSNKNSELHACWTGFKFLNWIQIHYLELDEIELNSNSTTFNSTIQLKTKWWRMFWKHTHEYGVGKKNLKKNTNPKIHISIPLD